MIRAIPSAVLLANACGAEAPSFERIDTHIHIHRDAPALLSALKAANWRGLDIVVCPASGDEPFDLEEKLDATLQGRIATAGARWPGRPPSTPADSKAPISPTARSPASADRLTTARSA